jgi:hypothetical protein
MQGNDFVKIVLYSPFHKMISGSVLLITVKGIRSGRAITTPVNYYREGNILWVLSNRDRTWWRNVRKEATVTLRYQGQEMHAHAESILDEQAVAVQIGEYVRHLPMSAGPLGIKLRNGCVETQDAMHLAKEKLFVKICLEE